MLVEKVCIEDKFFMLEITEASEDQVPVKEEHEAILIEVLKEISDLDTILQTIIAVILQNPASVLVFHIIPVPLPELLLGSINCLLALHRKKYMFGDSFQIDFCAPLSLL